MPTDEEHILFTLKLPRKLHLLIGEEAEKDRRSMSNYIIGVLEKHIPNASATEKLYSATATDELIRLLLQRLRSLTEVPREADGRLKAEPQPDIVRELQERDRLEDLGIPREEAGKLAAWSRKAEPADYKAQVDAVLRRLGKKN